MRSTQVVLGCALLVATATIATAAGPTSPPTVGTSVSGTPPSYTVSITIYPEDPPVSVKDVHFYWSPPVKPNGSMGGSWSVTQSSVQNPTPQPTNWATNTGVAADPSGGPGLVQHVSSQGAAVTPNAISGAITLNFTYTPYNPGHPRWPVRFALTTDGSAQFPESVADFWYYEDLPQNPHQFPTY